MNYLQFLRDRIGEPVYEVYDGRTCDHVIEGIKVDSTGIYILLKGGGSLNAEKAYLKGKDGFFPIKLMFSDRFLISECFQCRELNASKADPKIG